MEQAGERREKMKVLVNCSNHPSTTWSPEQRQGWDEIIDVSFPIVDPNWDTNDHGYQETVRNLWKNITDIVRGKEGSVYLYLVGEYSVCYEIFLRARNWLLPVVVPTTKREVVEIRNEDGSTTKATRFAFVRWRIIE
jgi:hypothetical protein